MILGGCSCLTRVFWLLWSFLIKNAGNLVQAFALSSELLEAIGFCYRSVPEWLAL